MRSPAAWLRGVRHPEAFHGDGVTRGFFEGWYVKLVSADRAARWAVIPGIFRGLLDAQARDITDAMLLAASSAIADVVAEPNPSFIVPSVFDPAVVKAVAAAVRGAAR